METRTAPEDVFGKARRWAERSPRAALACLFVALVVLRFPLLFFAPTFYAEEGIVYFRYALTHGVADTLLASHVGYYALVPNAAGLLAARVPLSLAPVVTTLIGLLAPSICALLVIRLERSPRERALCLALLVFTVTMRAEWCTTIHAQFWFAVALLLLLPRDAPRTPLGVASEVVLVLVAAMTGLVSCLLAPVFLLGGARLRDRRFALIGLVLAGALVAHALAGASRSPSWAPSELLSVLLMKLAVSPFVGRLADPLGDALLRDTSSPLVFVFALVAFSAWCAFVIAQSDGRMRLVALGSLFVGTLTIFFALPPHAGLAHAMTASRYAFVGVVPVCIALACSATTQTLRARRAVGLLIALALISGAVSGAKLTLDRGRAPSSFHANVVQLERDPGTTLALHQPRCRLSVNARAQREGFDVRSPRETGGDQFELTPGRYDRDVLVRVFVLAGPAHAETWVLDAGRFRPMGLLYYGEAPLTAPGRCFGGDLTDLRAYETFRGASRRLRFPENALASLPADVQAIYIGYGRDFADALAKGTFERFDRGAIAR